MCGIVSFAWSHKILNYFQINVILLLFLWVKIRHRLEPGKKELHVNEPIETLTYLHCNYDKNNRPWFVVSLQLFRYTMVLLCVRVPHSCVKNSLRSNVCFLYATVFPNHRTVFRFHHEFDVYTWHRKIVTLNCLSNTVIFVIFAVNAFTTGCNAFTCMCAMTLLNWIPPLFLIFCSVTLVVCVILSLQFASTVNWWLYVFNIYKYFQCQWT